MSFIIVPFILKKQKIQLQEQNFRKESAYSLTEINSQSLTLMRGWQINNFLLYEVQ